MEKKMKNQTKKRNESGYTLLEYAAGAAILIGILFTGLNALGGGTKDLLESVGQWVRSQGENLPQSE
jgi:Flp pilus assembly pilin Flp